MIDLGVWDAYESRLAMRGKNLREVKKNRDQRTMSRKIYNSLSYHNVLVSGISQDVAIINSDNLNQKTICSLPGENIACGAIVEWADNHWLVTAVDANAELYTKAIMLQCNYLLKWITPDHQIVERWCVVEDGTKYLTGETVSRYNENGMVLGDTRISVTLPKDEFTVKLSRDNRFLIDDQDSSVTLAYRLTKPFKLGGVYNDNGVMSFVMTEANSEDDDNFELRIADYYKHFPRRCDEPEVKPGTTVTGTGKKVWL